MSLFATWFLILLPNAMKFMHFLVWFKCPNAFWGHCKWKVWALVS